MNISNRFHYLYFVVPKAGSTTVRHSLKRYTDVGIPITKYEQHVSIEKFLQSDDSRAMFDAYFKFTFVRNPYDRIYSGYAQDKMAAVTWDNWMVEKKPIFDLIGDDFNRYLLEYVAQANITNDWDWISFCPMTAFSHRDGKYVLDWFGKAETLSADLATLGHHLKLDIQKVGDMNVKEKAQDSGLKYLDRYTRDSVQLVNKLYQDDFEFFDYPMLDPADFPKIIAG